MSWTVKAACGTEVGGLRVGCQADDVLGGDRQGGQRDGGVQLPDRSGSNTWCSTVVPVLIWRTSPGFMSATVPVSWNVLGPESLLGRTVTFQTSCVAVDEWWSWD